MALLPYVVAYIGLGIFAVAVLARIAMWVKMPLHIRWELYPVAHEGKRARYGGSYLEEVDWWKKPRETSLYGEIKAMFVEIVFLVALRENNRKLWMVSFPFHFGLYLVIGCSVLMIGGAILGAISPAIIGGTFGLLLRYGIVACGYGGLALALLGALGLLGRRLTDPELKDFTTPADIFNLLLFVVAFGVALLHALWVDRDFTRAFFVVQGLVTFGMPALAGEPAAVWLTTATVLLLGVLVAYIPLTHMSHFIGKYFAYHAIRWNDAPNLQGGSQEQPIQQVLGYKVGWAAPHIQGEGKKSWADLATEDMTKGSAK
jgi:nitrate reductase gamma subunit